MNRTDPSHPPRERLQALALGLLDDAEAAALGAHVWAREDCLEKLDRLSDAADPFLSKPRAVHSAHPPEPQPGSTLALVGRHETDADAGTAGPTPGVPGELPQLAQYRVLRRLGGGGMGVVYEAEDVRLGRRAALKVLRPALAQDPAARQRFLREARAAAGRRHDHVVTVYHVGEADGPAGRVPFLAMELLAGASLEATLRRRAVSPAEAARVGRKVAEGLAAAHRAGLVHRDVKPDNIWLEGDAGRVKLLDFGWPGRWRPTEHRVVVGTPAYMAAEQAAGRPVDGRADVFALGAVLCVILTGRPPYAAPSPEAVRLLAASGELADAFTRLDGCGADADLIALCKRCLSPAPADRPPASGAVAAAVGAHLCGVEERLRAAERDRAAAEARAPEEANTRRYAEAKVAEERKRRRTQLALVSVIMVVLLGGGAAVGLVHQGWADRRVRNARTCEGDLEVCEEALRTGNAEKAAGFLARAEGWQAEGGAGHLVERFGRGRADLKMLQSLDWLADLDRLLASDRTRAQGRRAASTAWSPSSGSSPRRPPPTTPGASTGR